MKAKWLLIVFLFFVLSGVAAAQVDINQADAKALAEAMDGVGLAKAEAIVAYRNEHGPFQSVDDLAKVHGIGAKTIHANRDAVVALEGSTDAGAANARARRTKSPATS